MKKVTLAVLTFMLVLLCASCGDKGEVTPPYPMQSETIRAAVYAPDDKKEFAQSVTSGIGRLYDDIYRQMGIKYEEKPNIIVYPTSDELKTAAGERYYDGLIAFHDGNTIYTVSDSVSSLAYHAPQYEYAQMMMEGANKKIPQYLDDGIAYYVTQSPMTGLRDIVCKAVEDKTLPTIETLEKLEVLDDAQSVSSAFILVDYIADEYGYEKLAELVKTPKIKKVLGKTEDEFYNEWLVWAKNAYARDFDKTKETEHFILKYMNSDENVIGEIENTLEGSFAGITGTLGADMAEKVTAEIYPTFEEFNRAMLTPSGGDGHMGNAFEGSFAIVSPNDIGVEFTRESMMRAYVHEFVHTVLNKVSDKIPAYLHEGMAAYLARQSGDFGMPELNIPWAFSHNSFPDMQTVKKMTAGTGDVYVIGSALVDYIVTEYGNEKLAALLKSPEDYFAVFGKTEDEFYSEWVEWLKSKYCK